MIHLTRNYSIASFIGIIIVSVALGVFYWNTALNSLIKQESESNTALTQSIANNFWPKYAEFVMSASNIPLTELPNHPNINQIELDIRQKLSGLRIAKVKVYNLEGLTVFSTEKSQIGENKSNNQGFILAKSGETASELTYRNQFSAFDQIIEDRNVISTYVPMRIGQNKTIEGVFEVYSDVTPFVNEIENTKYIVIGVVTTLMSLLYIFLIFYVRRAEKLVRDFQNEKQVQENKNLAKAASMDPVTNLLNRSSFISLANIAVNEARKQNKLVCLLCIDLDRFSVVNDSLGQQVGDQILLKAGSRLQAGIKHDDIICRISGNEFMIMLKNLESPESAAFIAERLLKKFVNPFHIEKRDIVVPASIGISVFPNDTQETENLLKHATTAMHKAKELGGNGYTFYTEELNSHALERLELEVELRQAINKDEFILFYQPRVSASTGKVVGMEALIRWQNPSRGLVPPLHFIPILEETGLIIPVGEMVINSACAQCKVWHDAGYDNLRVSVNLSTKQFEHENLVESVEKALKASDLPANFLEIEITESVLARDNNQAIQVLNRLRELGVYLSIDDFGTGYSSLNYLKDFPIHFLKIDRSFICEAINNQNHASITKAIIVMAKSLDLETVAEGVELDNQLEFIKAAGCNEIQGFLYSKPVPANIFLETVNSINNRIAVTNQSIDLKTSSLDKL